MNQSAEAFKERLTQNHIQYAERPQPDGSICLLVEVANHEGNMYNIVMMFGADGTEFNIRVFQLAKVPTERVRPMLRTLNKLNASYAWVRFFVDDDNEVTAAQDAIITTSSAARVCWEMLRRLLSVLGEAQKEIDAVLA